VVFTVPIPPILSTHKRRGLGRTRKLPDRCSRPDCTESCRSRVYCKTHAQAWRRKYQDDRCDWEGCTEIIATDDWEQERDSKNGKLKKVEGRTMGTGTRRRSYCRRHEVEHLRPSPEIEQLNLARLGDGLEVQGECWVPKPSRPSLKNNAATFDPEGSNGKAHWPYHRAVWDLLCGGHRQRLELDHLTGCAVQARCANPAHVQPVTRLENVARRVARDRARKARKPFSPRTCGPPINWGAAEASAVVAFAERFELPLPARAGLSP
jgi:hypothetical protein